MNGWIKLQRKLLDWEWYDDPITKSVFLDLLITANFETTKYRGTEILRGQTVMGYEKMAHRLGISTQNARTAINHLKSTGELTSKVTSKGQVITLINYDKYQLTEVETNKQINNEANRQLTGNQQATNNSIRSKEIKEYKEDKNYSGETSSPTPSQTMKDFIQMVDQKNERYEQFIKSLPSIGTVGIEKVRGELDKFASYWSELTKDGKRQRWELEKTFEVRRRIVTWLSRINTFTSQLPEQKIRRAIDEPIWQPPD